MHQLWNAVLASIYMHQLRNVVLASIYMHKLWNVVLASIYIHKLWNVVLVSASALNRWWCRQVTLDSVGLFADGAAVKTIGTETFRLCHRLVDDMVTVSTDEICAAIKVGFNNTRCVLEPAGWPLLVSLLVSLSILHKR